MVEIQRKRCRFSFYLDNAIFQPSKIKLVLSGQKYVKITPCWKIITSCMPRYQTVKKSRFQLKLTSFRAEIFNFEKMTLLMSRWKLVVLSCMTVMIKSSRDYYCTTNQNKLFQLWFYKVPSCHFRFKITFFKTWEIQKFENFDKNGLSKNL